MTSWQEESFGRSKRKEATCAKGTLLRGLSAKAPGDNFIACPFDKMDSTPKFSRKSYPKPIYNFYIWSQGSLEQ